MHPDEPGWQGGALLPDGVQKMMPAIKPGSSFGEQGGGQRESGAVKLDTQIVRPGGGRGEQVAFCYPGLEPYL